MAWRIDKNNEHSVLLNASVHCVDMIFHSLNSKFSVVLHSLVLTLVLPTTDWPVHESMLWRVDWHSLSQHSMCESAQTGSRKEKWIRPHDTVSFCQRSLFLLFPVMVISFSFPLFLIFSSFHGRGGFPTPHEEEWDTCSCQLPLKTHQLQEAEGNREKKTSSLCLFNLQHIIFTSTLNSVLSLGGWKLMEKMMACCWLGTRGSR